MTVQLHLTGQKDHLRHQLCKAKIIVEDQLER
jgi:hypothetical protein